MYPSDDYVEKSYMLLYSKCHYIFVECVYMYIAAALCVWCSCCSLAFLVCLLIVHCGGIYMFIIVQPSVPWIIHRSLYIGVCI